MIERSFNDVLELDCTVTFPLETDIMGKSIMPDPLNAKVRYECIIHHGDNKLDDIKFDRFRIKPSQIDDLVGYHNKLVIYLKNNTKCRMKEKLTKYIGIKKRVDEWDMRCD